MRGLMISMVCMLRDARLENLESIGPWSSYVHSSEVSKTFKRSATVAKMRRTIMNRLDLTAIVDG